MELNSYQNEVKSISSYNSDKMEKLLNIDSKKVYQLKKEHLFLVKKKFRKISYKKI